jgi:cell wall-associated NlpC family hydrolase
MLLSLLHFCRFVVGCFSDEAGSNVRERFAAKVCVVLIVACLVLGVSASVSAAPLKKIQHRRDKVAKVAKRWTGVPYVFGGITQSGVDCSGLTLRVYAKALDITLPHSAAAQAPFGKHDGWKRTWRPRNFHRGDLVFLKNTYKAGVSHAGVWIGRGRYVAAHSTGTLSSASSWGSYENAHHGFSVRPRRLRR